MKRDSKAFGRPQVTGRTKWAWLLFGTVSMQITPLMADTLCHLTVAPVEATGMRLAERRNGCEHYGICTVRNTGLSWMDAVEPVTYQMDVSACGNLGVHLMLIPGAEACCKPCANPTSLDLQVQPSAAGGAQGDLVLTVNSHPTVVASVKAACAKGSWKLVMSGLTATISGPDGKSASKDIPAKIAHFFRDPIRLYCFGKSQDKVTPNVTISRLRVLGLPDAAIDEQFTAKALNTKLWQVPFESAETPLVIPPTAKIWLKWPIAQPFPNMRGPFLETSGYLGKGWETYDEITDAIIIGNQYAVPISFDRPVRNFFRLRWQSTQPEDNTTNN